MTLTMTTLGDRAALELRAGQVKMFFLTASASLVQHYLKPGLLLKLSFGFIIFLDMDNTPVYSLRFRYQIRMNKSEGWIG